MSEEVKREMPETMTINVKKANEFLAVIAEIPTKYGAPALRAFEACLVKSDPTPEPPTAA